MVSENKSGMFTKLVLVYLMSLSICQTLYTSLFMTKSLSLALGLAVIPLSVLFCIMFKNRTTSIVSVLALCIFLSAGFFYVKDWFLDYLSWFTDLCNGFNDASRQQYTNLTLIAIAFIVTLLISIFTVKFSNFYITSLLLFSVFFVQLQLNIFVSNIAFVLFLFSFLLYYFFDVLKRRSKNTPYDAGSKLKYLLCIIPLCLIIIAVSNMLPQKNTRTASAWLDAKFDSMVDRVIDYFSAKDLSHFDYFSIDAAGFGESDRLGGNLTLSNVHVMDVKTEYPNLYLKATSKAFYDGHRWFDDNKQLKSLGKDRTYYSDIIRQDHDEFLNCPIISASDNNNMLYKNTNADINFINLSTKSLFIPPKLKSIELKNPISLLTDNDQMLSCDKIQKKGFEYRVEYSNLNLTSSELQDRLRLSYKGYYSDSYNSSVTSITIADNQTNTNSSGDILLNSAKNIGADAIYKRYTQLPDTTTQRVRQLAAEITKNKKNNYDRCKAIETYLSKNFPYTLKPGNPPRKKDFVDYFLFDGKKGYCTYYASAMTVLLRCLDIPARYVEGYILPPETNKKGIFEVSSQQAHAWVEVYFEGFGWIPFEPTAPFVATLYNDKTISANVTADMQGAAYADYMKMIDKYRNKDAGVSYLADNTSTAEASKTDAGFGIIITVIIILAVLLSALLILMLVNFSRLHFTIRKIKKADPNAAVLLAYSYILRVLKLLELFYNAGETPTDFGKRAEKSLNFSSYSLHKTDFNLITGYFVNARYSSTLLPKTAVQDMLSFIDILLKLEKDRLGRVKFFIARFIFGKI